MKKAFFILSLSLLLQACIKDDFIEDMISSRLSINTPLISLKMGANFQYTASYFNKVGKTEKMNLTWKSSDSSVLSIDSNGLANAIKNGSAIVSVTAFDSDNNSIKTLDTLLVNDTTIFEGLAKSGIANTTSSYALQGSFTLTEFGNDIILAFGSDYNASTQLPGLYIYLSNNPNSISGAYQIQRVATFSGAHTYTITNTKINDYKYVLYFCKPFNIKVGHGEIK